MKKLMFTAACAAMTAGAFAGVAQVYDMTINVKTQTCKDNKSFVTDKAGNEFRCYRAQTSVKFEGKFWGCGCYTIANPIADQYGRPELKSVDTEDIDCDNNNNSYMFWAPKAAFHQVDFAWSLLQLSGKKSENIEGIWAADFYVCDGSTVASEPCLVLSGAGYGTAYNAGLYEDEVSPFNYIKSMSGNVVGTFDVDQLDVAVGCAYCGGSCDCGAFAFCPSCKDEYIDTAKAPAYGTFTLKYNSTLANKINNGKTITAAYKFKDFVTAEFACIGTEPTDCSAQKKVYDTAKEATQEATIALSLAKENVATVTDEALKAKWDATQAAAELATTNNAAFLAVSNFLGATVAQWKNDGGLVLRKKTDKYGTSSYDLDTTITYNKSLYNWYGMIACTTTAVDLAGIAKGEAWDEVNTNEYCIIIEGVNGGNEVSQYGSKAAAAYIAEQYTKVAAGTKLQVYGAEIPAERRLLTATAFTKEIVNKFEAYATTDAAALVKANTALETAQEKNDAARAAFAEVFDAAVVAAEAYTTAKDNYKNRADLQKTAAAAVVTAEKNLEDAETTEAAAKAAYEACLED